MESTNIKNTFINLYLKNEKIGKKLICFDDFNFLDNFLKKNKSLNIYDIEQVYFNIEKKLIKFPENLNLLILISNFYLRDVEKYAEKLIIIFNKIIDLGCNEAIIYYRLFFIYDFLLEEEKSIKNLYLAYEKNKSSKKFSILLQYEIISSILFKYNYKRKDNFYKLYKDKINDFPELSLVFKQKYQTWLTNNKKIRIGFVSGDLREHPVGIYLKSLLSHLNLNKYDVYLYSTVVTEDTSTEELKKYSKKYSYVNIAKSKESAEIIYSDNIDVLFDLSGHTGNSGLVLFKYKPAKIQISWLGYFASIGINEIDYFLTSKHCVLEEEEKYFNEKVLKLPNSHVSYDFTNYDKSKVIKYPFEINDFFTFGVFQNINKIKEEDFIIWHKIMNEFPTCKFIIKSQNLDNKIIKENFIKKINKYNVDMERIELIGKTSFQEYLDYHNKIDIMIDLYNVSGCTTTCQSLYMEVPVMTFKGVSMTTRYGEQFNKILNLNNFICNDLEDLIKKLKNLFLDKENFKNIKKNLRENLLNSSIGNPQLFVKDFDLMIEKIICNNKEYE